MKLQMRSILVPITFMFLAGCIPAEYVEVPALRGRVIDSDHRPVSDATLRITARLSSYPSFVFSVRPDGTFASPEKNQFFLFIPGEDLAWPDYSLTVVTSEGRSSPLEIPSGVRLLFLTGPPA